MQRVAVELHLLDAKTEDSEAVLPLPEVTWLTLLDHQERQSAEGARLAEVWHDHGCVCRRTSFKPSPATPM